MRDLRNMVVTLVLGVSAFVLAFLLWQRAPENSQGSTSKVIKDSPPCVQVFEAIEKYSQQYSIPKDYAYGVAFRETRYRGPFQWNYEHAQTSPSGALGPMQVMFSTAKGLFPKEKFTADFLRTNIDFNVHCSMKLLRRLHDKYGDWKLVFGAYNTGSPVVNSYAEQVYAYKREL